MSQAEQQQTESNRARVLQAAGLVGVFFIVARGLGLLRELITLSFLGTDSVAAQAYAVANQFPDAIFFVIAGGAMGSAFIPTFTAYFANQDEVGGWRLFSGVINLLLLVLIVVAGVTAVFATPFVSFFYKQQILENPAILPEAVLLMRVMLISTLIFGVGGIVTGALQSHQHFLFPAMAPVVYNLGIIIFGIVIKPPQLGLAIGAVVGALGYLVVQLPTLRQKGGRYTAVLSLTDPGITKVLRLMGPRVLGLSFSRLNQFVILFLTGRFAVLSGGSLVALLAALRVTLLPQGIIGQALGTAAFPTLSTLAAQEEFDQIRKILNDALRIIYFIGLPISLLLMILSQPIITILFERGQFNAQSTQLASWALLFFGLGLVALTMLEVINRTFYALSDTWTPVLAGAVQIVAMALLSGFLSLWLFPALGWLPLGGIALGFSVSNVVEVLLLWLLLRRKMGRLDGSALLAGLLPMSGVGIVMAVTTLFLRTTLATQAAWLQLLLSGLIGGVVYLTGSWLLRIPELRQLTAVINRN